MLPYLSLRSNPPDMSAVPFVVTRKKPLVFSDKRQFQHSYFDLSDYSSMHMGASGLRYPLDPSWLRHVEISLSALSAAGIIVS